MVGRSSIKILFAAVMLPIIFSLAACVSLPKESTRKMANEIASLSSSFGTLSKSASTEDTAEEWMDQMLRSGVALNPILRECNESIAKVKNQIYERLEEITPNKPQLKPSRTASITIEWEDIANNLGASVKACQFMPHTKIRPLKWNPTGKEVGALMAPTETPLRDYMRPTDLMVQSLADYYTAIANAADDKDLASQEAKLKEINATVGALTGTAASFASGPAGPVFVALTTAVANLAVDLCRRYPKLT